MSYRLASAMLKWFILWVWLGPVAALAQVHELIHARVTTTVGNVERASELELPYHWDTKNKGQQGAAQFELRFSVHALPQELWGLYVPRVGNAYSIWLNDTLLDRRGDLVHYNGSDYSQMPQFVSVAPSLLRQNNVLRVRVRADTGRRGGLSQVFVGPYEQVYPLFLKSYHWRVRGSVVVVAFSIFIGLMGLALWWTQTDFSDPLYPRRDSLYLLVALAEFFWTIRVGDVLIEQPPLPWPWWGVVAVMSIAGWGTCMTLFCIDVADWRTYPSTRWVRNWMALMVASSAMLSFAALGWGYPGALTWWYATLLATFAAFGLVFLAQAVRQASLQHRLVAGATVLNVIVGVRDLYVFRINPAYPDNSWLRYSSVLFGLTLGYVVLRRFREASTQARDLMRHLEDRVTQRELELEQSYQTLEQLAREQERGSERTRILRDMHDGVGSHISSAIRQLQSGKSSQAEVLDTLRDSLDQLKLTIDSMNLPDGDVTALLANLRYRLEPRLAASDIELQWDVELLAPIPRLDAQSMRQLQFMVFEALSNVLQHARAHRLRIEAADQGNSIRLLIIDDGTGFDVEALWRKGLRIQRERALAIGARLLLSSRPGHTVVEILLDR